MFIDGRESRRGTSGENSRKKTRGKPEAPCLKKKKAPPPYVEQLRFRIVGGSDSSSPIAEKKDSRGVGEGKENQGEAFESLMLKLSKFLANTLVLDLSRK